ncbi:caleosin domain-containing protein [Atractiella rhizophila]|nr:caleosin domain-containing protein [Atractiella rhizophila]
MERPLYISHHHKGLKDAGTARAFRAASDEKPLGTEGWVESHRDKTVLHQHCLFFDRRGNGIIWPLDTYTGFRELGYNILLSIFSMMVIHGGFAYFTNPSIFPDPFFRIYLHSIHRAKHGSDSGTYDNEGRFKPQNFEDIWRKYSSQPGQKGLSLGDTVRMVYGQRCVMDFFGMFAAVFEWLAAWILLWPSDGVIKKEDVRGIYDGSFFYRVRDEKQKRKRT